MATINLTDGQVKALVQACEDQFAIFGNEDGSLNMDIHEGAPEFGQERWADLRSAYHKLLAYTKVSER